MPDDVATALYPLDGVAPMDGFDSPHEPDAGADTPEPERGTLNRLEARTKAARAVDSAAAARCSLIAELANADSRLNDACRAAFTAGLTWPEIAGVVADASSVTWRHLTPSQADLYERSRSGEQIPPVPYGWRPRRSAAADTDPADQGTLLP